MPYRHLVPGWSCMVVGGAREVSQRGATRLTVWSSRAIVANTMLNFINMPCRTFAIYGWASCSSCVPQVHLRGDAP